MDQDPLLSMPNKRSRRSSADMQAIRTEILAALLVDQPMTVRQVFYQLVVRGALEKTEAQYQGTVIRLLTEMRMDGTIPFTWITDESRRRRLTQTHDSIEDALAHTAKFYRRSALAQSSDYVEIWCEKDALAGVMWGPVSEYDVPLMVSRGMPSITFLHGTVREILRADQAGKQTYIYQFGDHDPSGVLIPQMIQSRLNQMCERLDCRPPIIERVALTEDHIDEYNLPTRPTKRDGNKHIGGFEGESVELDALPPRVLRQMVTEVIEQHISPEETEVLRTAEASERELLRAWKPGH
jgi:hypothetical protein